jgi:alpha-1,2-mannosyltransferase
MIFTLSWLPIAVISGLGWRYGPLIRPLFNIYLTNVQATWAMMLMWVHGSDFSDSWQPMLDALAVLKGPHEGGLYETLFFDGHVRFQYPPMSLLPIEGLKALGLSSIRSLNRLNSIVFVLNAAAVGGLVWLLARKSPPRTPVRPVAPLPIALAMLAFVTAFIFYPLVRASVLGQIQIWIDFLFTVALICWVQNRRLWAGLLLGLICSLKPQAGLLLVWGLLWREWAFATGVIATLAPLTAVSLVHYGVSDHITYLKVLSFLSQHGESYFANNSVNGIANWYFSSNDSLRWYDGVFTPYSGFVYAATLLASIAALLIIVLPPLLRRKSQPGLNDFGAAAICTVAGSPVAWEHHYGILYPLFIVALFYVLGLPSGGARRWTVGLLLLSWVMVADFIPFASLLNATPLIFVQAYVFIGALLLLGLLLKSTRRAGWGPASVGPV